MRSTLTNALLEGHGTATLYDYELDELRGYADVVVLKTDVVQVGGRDVKRHEVRFVMTPPAVRFTGPPADDPLSEPTRDLHRRDVNHADRNAAASPHGRR
jgi:hypothetical protein